MRSLRYTSAVLVLALVTTFASASDLIGTWQLPPVAGVNTLAVSFGVTRPSVQSTPLKVLGTFQLGATAFNKVASPPASYLVSQNQLFYQDPTTFQKVALTPQPGDKWRIYVSIGIWQPGSNGPCSPITASQEIYIPDGNPPPPLYAAFTSPPVNARQTVPPPIIVTFTYLP